MLRGIVPAVNAKRGEGIMGYHEECEACREARSKRRLRTLAAAFFLLFFIVLGLSLHGCGGSEEAGQGYGYAMSDAARICQAYAECLGNDMPGCEEGELRRVQLLCGTLGDTCVTDRLASCAGCYVERGCEAWGTDGVPVPECMERCAY